MAFGHLLPCVASIACKQTNLMCVCVCVECVDKGIRQTLACCLSGPQEGGGPAGLVRAEGREELSSSSLSPCALTTLPCHIHSQGFWTGGEEGRAWALQAGGTKASLRARKKEGFPGGMRPLLGMHCPLPRTPRSRSTQPHTRTPHRTPVYLEAEGWPRAREQRVAAAEVAFWNMTETELRQWVEANPGHGQREGQGWFHAFVCGRLSPEESVSDRVAARKART